MGDEVAAAEEAAPLELLPPPEADEAGREVDMPDDEPAADDMEDIDERIDEVEPAPDEAPEEADELGWCQPIPCTCLDE